MTTINLKQDNFEPTVRNSAMVVVGFWAPSNAACDVLESTLQTTAQKFPDVVVGQVNAEEERGLAQMFGIESLPVLMIFRDSIVLYSEPLVPNAEQLERILRRASALDMDRVREDIAEEARAREARNMRLVCPTMRRGPMDSR
jgi:thioredoxin 1